MQAVYEINVSEMLGSNEYKGMFEDMARFFFIQFMIQAMLVMMAPDQYKLFAADFLMLLIFVALGVMFYWLVFKKIIHIV
jgi:hypothetical protein